MKKQQKNKREFEKLKSQLAQLQAIASHTKSGKLWYHEAAARKKIKALRELKHQGFNGYERVYAQYIMLLDDISQRLIQYYNQKNHTDYSFEEVVKQDQEGYLSAGIMSVLFSVHIPELVAEEFKHHFPQNPKDEFPAARALKRHVILHLGDTNTGKTYHALERLKQAKNGVYLAPLRILALENFERLNREGVRCSLLTGEEEVVTEDASLVSATVEKLDISQAYEVAVIDEIQMIEHPQRGQAWTRALLGLRCAELHLCGAHSAKELLLTLLEDCGDWVEIKEYERQTLLEICEMPFQQDQAQSGDALVVFSKRQALLLSKHYRERGFPVSVIYGDLPPEVRKMQYGAFASGCSKLLITTDAIGMGVNLPIRRIIFMSIEKFDGEELRVLTSQEVKQIAGRAGRRGLYETGYVGAQGLVQRFLKESLENADPPISQAVLGPGEAILQIKNLPLKEKLALWSTREELLPYYRKMDVRDYLLVLEAIKGFRLPERTQYRLMRLPFDVNSSILLDCFLDFVEEHFIDGGSTLTKPDRDSDTLGDLELYYQKINLYYSFSKNFDLRIDSGWVTCERESVGRRINALLAGEGLYIQ